MPTGHNDRTKLKPLTPHARGVLRGLANLGPAPSREINPGVVDRFHREGLTVTVNLPSPYKSHKGRTCAHEQITEAGRTKLQG